MIEHITRRYLRYRPRKGFIGDLFHSTSSIHFRRHQREHAAAAARHEYDHARRQAQEVAAAAAHGLDLHRSDWADTCLHYPRSENPRKFMG